MIFLSICIQIQLEYSKKLKFENKFTNTKKNNNNGIISQYLSFESEKKDFTQVNSVPQSETWREVMCTCLFFSKNT